ncbi:hypothetical protein A2127_01145, partial [Candidatus Jorgensenbacteria bacterium GWC1_48_12]
MNNPKNNFIAVFNDSVKGIESYLESSFQKGHISEELLKKAKVNVLRNLQDWLFNDRIDQISPRAKEGITKAIEEGRWPDLVEAYIDDVAFGTAGIRGLAALSDEELLLLNKEGLDAPILKGPNTINNIVFARTATAIARYMETNSYSSIVIGFDSRIQGKAFAELLASIFLNYDIKVYFFDTAVPYPEVLFAVPTLKADIGLFISASHNDRRYNGFKICSLDGAPISVTERDNLYDNYIKKTEIAHVPEIVFERLTKKTNFQVIGEEIHKPFVDHMRQFLINKELIKEFGPKVLIGYSAFNGAGRNTVPGLLENSNFTNVQIIKELFEMDGLFPAFQEHPDQQPDPGDESAARIAIEAYKKEYPADFKNKNLDIIIGTDPDADRASVIIKVPDNQLEIFNEPYTLLPADEIWLLVLWYRLQHLKRFDDKFIAYTHVTSDSIGRLAKKYDVGAVRTWVGFTWIASAVNKVWQGEKLSRDTHPYLIYETNDMNEMRVNNISGLEQSYGFGFFGGPAPDERSFGSGGHVKDKDGTLGALMLAEIAAYAKSQNKTLIDLIDEIYLNPEIGLFVNYYEAEPRYGAYRSLEGFSKKVSVLKNALKILEDVKNGKDVRIADLKVSGGEQYQTGKYDTLHNWKGFPDEGIRFWFSDRENWLILRPSGTAQALRFHTQLHFEVTEKDIL